MPDVKTVAGGDGLHAYRVEAELAGGTVVLAAGVREASGDDDILRPASRPFQPTGGLKLLEGNLGRAVVKISAVKPEHRRIEAPAIVFDHQEDLPRAFAAGELDRDFVAVVRFQGPRANGMPELHKLMPPLGVLQDRGFKVALVTDGRLSGASGKVTSAIHVSPEAEAGGALARLITGDPILIDPEAGRARGASRPLPPRTGGARPRGLPRRPRPGTVRHLPGQRHQRRGGGDELRHGILLRQRRYRV